MKQRPYFKKQSIWSYKELQIPGNKHHLSKLPKPLGDIIFKSLVEKGHESLTGVGLAILFTFNYLKDKYLEAELQDKHQIIVIVIKSIYLQYIKNIRKGDFFF